MSSFLQFYIMDDEVFTRSRTAFISVLEYFGINHVDEEKSILNCYDADKRLILPETVIHWIKEYTMGVWLPLFDQPDDDLKAIFHNYKIDKSKIRNYKRRLTDDIRFYVKVLLAHHHHHEEYDPSFWQRYEAVDRDVLRDWSRDELSTVIDHIKSLNDSMDTDSTPTQDPTGDPVNHPSLTVKPQPQTQSQHRLRRLTLQELTQACPLEDLISKIQEELPRGVMIEGKSISVSTDADGEAVLVIGIDDTNNVLFDAALLSRVKDWITFAPFAPEAVVGMTPNKVRWYRIEAIEDCYFTLGQGVQVMESCKMSPVGYELLDIACKIYGVQNGMVDQFISKNDLTGTVEFKPFMPNLIQIVVAETDTYGTHHDRGPETTIMYQSESDDNPLAEYIPYDYEQRVLTMVFTIITDEEAVNTVHPEDGFCYLNHYRKGKRVSTLKTTSCYVHLQLFGAQSKLMHDVKPVATSAASNCKRLILSFRCSAPIIDSIRAPLEEAINVKYTGRKSFRDRVHRKDTVYTHTNVLGTAITNGPINDAPPQQCDNHNGVTATSPKRAIQRTPETNQFNIKDFMVNYKSHASTKKLGRPASQTCVKRGSFELLRGVVGTRLLLEHGYFLRSYDVPGDGPDVVDWLYDKFELGETSFLASQVRQKKGIIGNNTQVHVYNHNDVLPDLFVVEQAYKNKLVPDDDNPFGFCEVINHMVDDPFWVYNQEPDSVRLWLGPRGGNGEEAGRHGQPPMGSKHKAETYSTAAFQNLTSSISMDMNVRVEAAVHLWAPLKWGCKTEGELTALKESVSCDRKEKAIYMGYWYFCSASIGRHPKLAWPENSYTNWLKEVSTLYFIQPLFNTVNRPPAFLHDLNHKLRPFSVSAKSTQIHKWVSDKAERPHLTSADVVQDWLIQEINERSGSNIDCGEHLDEESDCNVSVEEFIVQAGRIAISSFARIDKQNVIQNEHGENELGYLCGEEWLHLGWVLGTNSVPHPIRTYNLQTFAFIQAMAVYVPKGDSGYYRRVSLVGIDDATTILAQCLFKASVLRLAGVVGWYSNFAQYVKGKHPSRLPTKLLSEEKTNLFIPGMDDVELYSEYLASRHSDGLQQSMSPYNKTLYWHSLIAECKGNVKPFIDFLKKLSKCLLEKVKKQHEKRNSTRESWVELMYDCYEKSRVVDDEKGNMEFLASLVVADVEEVLDKPFGKPKSIYLGSGGKRGLSYVSDGTARTNLSKATEVVNYLNTKASSEVLQALGLYKENDECAVILNEKPFEIIDVDNVGCKVSVNEGKTTGSRIVINYPGLNQLYDFPLRPNMEEGFELDCLTPICRQSVSCLHTQVFRKPIQEQFQYSNEIKQWPFFCEKMKEWIEEGTVDPVYTGDFLLSEAKVVKKLKNKKVQNKREPKQVIKAKPLKKCRLQKVHECSPRKISKRKLNHDVGEEQQSEPPCAEECNKRRHLNRRCKAVNFKHFFGSDDSDSEVNRGDPD